MNDFSAVLPAELKDRKTGLLVFGILLIILGCMAGLAARLMLLGLVRRMIGSENIDANKTSGKV
jgi:hypothetical protein